jgi:hypothetical protein
MSEKQRQIVKDCIAFYDARGWDWSMPVAYLMTRFMLGLKTYFDGENPGNSE